MFFFPYFRVNEKTQIENKTADVMENVTDPRALSPLNRSRTRKAEKKKIEFAPNTAPAKVNKTVMWHVMLFSLYVLYYIQYYEAVLFSIVIISSRCIALQIT